MNMREHGKPEISVIYWRSPKRRPDDGSYVLLKCLDEEAASYASTAPTRTGDSSTYTALTHGAKSARMSFGAGLTCPLTTTETVKIRNAQGGGSIRQRPDGRWEARFTVGRDPGTGKQIQRSFTGKTQKEVREKMQAVAVEVNQGTYTAPQKMTAGQWLDVWQRDYLGGVKPALGAVRLSDLHPHTVQQCINGLEGYTPSTVRQAYKVLHNALEKAVELDYIPRNPADKCTLPRMEQEEIKPFDDEQTAALLQAVKGGRLEYIVNVALFTGLRMSELLGLTWDAVDFDKGTITINKQLAHPEHRKAGLFISPKSGKARTITPAASVFAVLRAQRRRQIESQLRAGPLWDNAHNRRCLCRSGWGAVP